MQLDFEVFEGQYSPELMSPKFKYTILQWTISSENRLQCCFSRIVLKDFEDQDDVSDEEEYVDHGR